MIFDQARRCHDTSDSAQDTTSPISGIEAQVGLDSLPVAVSKHLVPSRVTGEGVRLAPDSLAFTIFLGTLSALPPLSIDMGLPGIPAIEASLPGADGHGALTLSLFLVGFAAAPLGCGPLADRFGRQGTMAVGLVIFTLTAMACTLAESFPLLLLGRLLQGIAAGSCVIMPLAIVRDAFDGSTARHHLSRITAVVGLAPMLAPVLGGWVMAAFGWRAIYGAQALCGLLLLAVTLALFRETLPIEKRRTLDPATLVAGYAIVMRDRAFRGFTLLYAFTFACMFSFIASAPAVLMGRMGLTPTVFALVFGLSSCGTLFGALVSGRMNNRRVPGSAIIRTGLLAMIAATLVLLILAGMGAASVPTIVLLVATTIFCFGLVGPTANHYALRALPHVAGSASGVLRCTQMVMGALASALVAVLQPLDQPVLVMASLMVAASLAAAATLLWLRSACPNGLD